MELLRQYIELLEQESSNEEECDAYARIRLFLDQPIESEQRILALCRMDAGMRP